MKTLLIAFAAAFVAIAASADPEIQQLSAVATGSSVAVRFRLANAFKRSDTVHALESGLPTSFTYVVEVYRDRPRWFDDGVGRSRIEVIATFNSVTREYLLNYRRDRKLVRSETFTSLAELEKRMTEVDEPNLFDIGSRRSYKLKVRVKADFGRGFLLYVIPWQISTRWREVKIMAAESRP